MSKVKFSKLEAADFLGVSPRTVERHAQRGSLHPVYEHGENGKEAFYKLSELEKLQSNLNTQTHTSEVVGGEVTGVDSCEVQSPDAGNSIAQQTSLVLTIREIVFEVLAAVRIKQSPLDSYRELSEAAAQGWILPTSVVKQMIKTRPHGEQFIRGSFKFIRTGRIGIQAGWRVERL